LAEITRGEQQHDHQGVGLRDDVADVGGDADRPLNAGGRLGRIRDQLLADVADAPRIRFMARPVAPLRPGRPRLTGSPVP
jgi:hypothetical protein